MQRFIIRLFIIFAFTTFTFAENKEEMSRLTVLFTNDVHGGIVPQKAEFLNPEFPPMLGGAASAAGIIKGVRDRAEKQGFSVLLIDGGDIFQGTLVGSRSEGMAVVKYMNMIGYDATVPGNHDFDQGQENLIELIKASEFPWVSSNIYDKETGERWAWVKPWTIVEKKGLKIGITGATTAGTEHMSYPENIKGLEFRNEVASLQETADELRKQSVDLVVALVHVGLPYDPKEGYERLKNQAYEKATNDNYVDAMEIAHFVQGIDLLLGGHIHKGYEKVWEDPVNHTICMQNYGNGGNLGWLDLQIHMPSRSIAGYDYPAEGSSLLLLQEDEFWPDTSVANFIEEQQRKYEKGFKEVIGKTETALTRSSVGEAPMNNFLADVMRQRVDADFAFMNFGGIRSNIRKGPITREDIFKVLPFGNEIVVFEASGKLIKVIVEQKLSGSSSGLVIAGGKVVYNREYSDGQRVVYLEIKGESLDPDKKYRLATNDYLIEGNSGLYMLKDIPRSEVDFTGVRLREAVIQYIQENSPVSAEVDGRWKQDDDAKPSPEWIKKFGHSQAIR